MVADTLNIYALVIVLAGWIFTLCFHEFSHALVAYAGRDKSVKKKGYVLLAPDDRCIVALIEKTTFP